MGLVARVAVGVVLLAAGALKLRQPSWPATAAAFGAPAPVARAMPFAELALGGLLVAGVGLPWTAFAALILLAGFTAAVAVRLAQGAATPCGCFGESSAEPVGRRTVVRNLALGALAFTGRRGGGGILAGLAGVVAGAAFVAESRARTGAR